MLDNNEVEILNKAKDVLFSIDMEESHDLGERLNDFIVDNTNVD